jgi:hypothetical protein
MRFGCEWIALIGVDDRARRGYFYRDRHETMAFELKI